MTTARELRQKYLAFFESKGHMVFPSGLLIPYDVTGRLDESLLFNGAGMVQFKPYFRGVAEPPNARLTTAQKCIRTGDIDVVGDDTHLTFFEMLGNFSFGDYFKADAIRYSWEFLTDLQWLGLDPKRLSFTVFEEDDEAYVQWAEVLGAAGIDPASRVFRLGEKTNYWPANAFSSGPPGPCGPNSEMFYWVPDDQPAPVGAYSREDYLRDEKAGLWMEIWNDVFIQYEWQGRLRDPERAGAGYEKTGMPELPFRSIDTGMGLERTAAVLAGKRSVYEIDVFEPILRLIDELRPGRETSDDVTKARRIVADHIRTACFCIADGILPSNNGRGYVLRRLIRRAVLKGDRVLGFAEPFFHRVFEAVRQSMGDHYTELNERADVVRETLYNEEVLFRRTLRAGNELLQTLIAGRTRLGGSDAFKLYDTYGFPLEVTEELCAEAGIEVDTEGYEAAMTDAQARSRGASAMENVYGGLGIRFDFNEDSKQATPTRFVGYTDAAVQTRVSGAIADLDEHGKPTGRVALAIDETPFYTESGGQVADTGRVTGEGFALNVVDLVKQDGVVVHLAELVEWQNPRPIAELSAEEANAALLLQIFNKQVLAQINLPRRFDIMRNHTATHLLHAALRDVLGKHVAQAGSLVAPEHLRFDFAHGKAVSPEELAQIEAIVNAQVLANVPVVVHEDLSLAEAKARGAMALFGEKYGERVRMVEVEGVSKELCGGTHVNATGEIGLIKILSESSAASGVRRIEAVTGLGAYRWVVDQDQSTRKAAGLLKSSPKELVQAVERVLEQVKEERRKREKLASQGSAGGDAALEQIGKVEFAVQSLSGADPKDAGLIADRLADGKPGRVTLVVNEAEGKLTFVCKVGAEALASGAHAGNLVREAAKVAGGGGGGRPDFATAGGKDPSKVSEAIAAARAVLAAIG